jgi:hypothetical protein
MSVKVVQNSARRTHSLGEGVIGATYKVINDHLVLIEVTERVKDEDMIVKQGRLRIPCTADSCNDRHV